MIGGTWALKQMEGSLGVGILKKVGISVHSVIVIEAYICM